MRRQSELSTVYGAGVHLVGEVVAVGGFVEPVESVCSMPEHVNEDWSTGLGGQNEADARSTSVMCDHCRRLAVHENGPLDDRGDTGIDRAG